MVRLQFSIFVGLLGPDFLGDGVDIIAVEQGGVGRSELVVGRFGGMLGGFGRAKPGADEARSKRAPTEATLGAPDEWDRAFVPIGSEP